jgi:hypothetical protein
MKLDILVIFILASILNCSYFIYDCKKFTDNPQETHYCDLHNIKFSKKIVHINFGLHQPVEFLYTPEEFEHRKNYDSLYQEALKTDFKYAYLSNSALGGCVQESQSWAIIYFCKKCNENREKWLKEHDNLKPFKYYKIEERTKVGLCAQCSQAKKRIKKTEANDAEKQAYIKNGCK